MTRAKEKLYMSSYGSEYKLVRDINPKYLRLKGDCNFPKLYKVNIEDYLFRDKISNVYNKEEVVRQYVLKTLNESYNYPLDNIFLEEKVNIGSRIGKADICIKDNKNEPILLGDGDFNIIGIAIGIIKKMIN